MLDDCFPGSSLVDQRQLGDRRVVRRFVLVGQDRLSYTDPPVHTTHLSIRGNRVHPWDWSEQLFCDGLPLCAVGGTQHDATAVRVDDVVRPEANRITQHSDTTNNTCQRPLHGCSQ